MGPRPCSHGPVPARCLPRWAAGAPAPAYHSCLRVSAWPHRIPGAVCPSLLPPLALTGSWALPPPGTGWPPPLSGPPSQGRINRILSQPPVPAWAHLWVDSGGLATAEGRPSAEAPAGAGRASSRQAGGRALQEAWPGEAEESGSVQDLHVACGQDPTGSAGTHILRVT